MSDTFTPPTQLELDLIHVYNGLQHMMDEEAKMNMAKAIGTLQKYGAPDPNTYSLTHIEAENDEDLNLKLHLATLQPFKDFVNGKISEEEAISQVMPLHHAILRKTISASLGDFSLSAPEYPLTIKVDDYV